MPQSSKLRNFFKPTKSKKDAEEIVAEQGPTKFSFKFLSSATESFHAKNKLGKGGFAQVYKGKLNDGREIAVKRPLQISDKGKELVLNELKLLLGSAHHRNIVKFLGFCSHREEMLLVFEFASNGSLDYLLFTTPHHTSKFPLTATPHQPTKQRSSSSTDSKTDRADVLEWKRTYDIIVGVARALLYLHERSHNVIIHCDIKPANILIDENWVPKIADFGTANLLPQDQTHVNISEAAGTFEYSAPEYKCSGHVSPKADIYSFGVVVLELISGEKNWLSHDRSSNGQGLRDRANELYKEGRVSEFMDQKLIRSAVPDQVQLCVHIGVMCTEYYPEPRPTMGRIYLMLSENHSSSSTLVEEPMRDGSSSASSSASSAAQNSGPTELADNGSSSWADSHMENEGLPKNKRLTRAPRIKAEDVQSYIPSIPSSSCSSMDGPTELANNGSSSGADIHMENEGVPKNKRLTRAPRIEAEDVQSYIPSIPSSSCSNIDGPTKLTNNGSSSGAAIHLENEGLPKHKRLTRARRIQLEDVQSYIPSIPSSSCSSIDGPTELTNNGSSAEADIHSENEGLPIHRRLTRAQRIQSEDVQSYIPSIPSSSCSSIDGPTELTNNGSSSGADIHLENEGLPKYRRLTHSRRIQSEDVQSYISSIQIEPEEGLVRAAVQEVAVAATPTEEEGEEEEEEEEEDSSPTCSYDQANNGSSKEGSQTAADGGGG